MTTEIFPASIIFNYAAYQHRFMTQHVNGIHLSAGNPAIDIFCAQSNIRWHSKYLRPSFSQILGIQNWLAPWSQPESLHQNGRKMLKSQTMQHRNLVKWYQLSFTLARFSTSGEFEVTITTISNIHTANTCRNWELKDLLDQSGYWVDTSLDGGVLRGPTTKFAVRQPCWHFVLLVHHFANISGPPGLTNGHHVP